MAHDLREVGTYSSVEGIKSKEKEIKQHGQIVRAGDVIKFGRVPIIIKESTFDTRKYKEIKEQL